MAFVFKIFIQQSFILHLYHKIILNSNKLSQLKRFTFFTQFDIIFFGEFMIIDIEGTDGSGKATQTKLLYNYLTDKGYNCKVISFPNYNSNSSAPVKMYLNGDLGENASLNSFQTSSLFAVDRLITMRSININDYDFILLDRYTPSNMIHQSTKILDKNELDKFLDWLEDFEYNKLSLPKPDLIMFLDMPVEYSIKLTREREGLKNNQKRDILEEDATHLTHAYARAKYLAKKYGWETIQCADDKLKSIEAVHKEIIKMVENYTLNKEQI